MVVKDGDDTLGPSHLNERNADTGKHTSRLGRRWCRNNEEVKMYVGWSFNSGTDFFVSEWVDLTASRACLLRSSVLVLVCTYSSVPATDESTSGSHFL